MIYCDIYFFIYTISIIWKGLREMIHEDEFTIFKERIISLSKYDIDTDLLRIYGQDSIPNFIKAILHVDIFWFQSNRSFLSCNFTVREDRIVIGVYALRYNGETMKILLNSEINSDGEVKHSIQGATNELIINTLLTFLASNDLNMNTLNKLRFFRIDEIKESQGKFYYDSIEEFNTKHKKLLLLNSRYNSDFSVYDKYISKKECPRIAIDKNKIFIIYDNHQFITMEFREDSILFINEDKLILYDVVELDHKVAIQYNEDYWAVLYCMDIVLNALDNIRMQQIKQSKMVENINSISKRNKLLNGGSQQMKRNILIE